MPTKGLVERFLLGAADRGRTGTVLLPRDFKFYFSRLLSFRETWEGLILCVFLTFVSWNAG